MMAYREAPPAAGLPFPRRGFAGLTAATILAAAMMVALPLPFLASARGWMMFKNGGSGMYLLVLFALAGAASLGTLGAFAVRGKRLPLIVVTAIPALPVIAGALLMRHDVGRAIGAVGGESVDPSQAVRILAEGTSEADSLVILGCFLGAAGFGAAALALLGGCASVDRARANAPAGAGFILTLVLGGIGLFATLSVRIALRSNVASAAIVIPSLMLVTVIASIAARNGPLARGWHDRREGSVWIASLFAAALAAGAGLVLLNLSALYAAESTGLGAISGESVDPSQKARIIAEVVSEVRGASICAWVDGLLAFAIVAAGLVSAVGRGPDGALRSPLGAPSFVALGAVVLALGGLFGTRASTFSALGGSSQAQRARAGSPANGTIDLPRVTSADGLDSTDVGGPTVTVEADGVFQHDRTSPCTEVLLIADHRAKWSAVVKAITSRLEACRRTESGGERLPNLSIRLASPAPTTSVDLGRYAVFIGPSVPAFSVSLDDRGLTSDDARRIRPSPFEDMDWVVARVRGARRDGAGYYGPRRVVLVPPSGAW